MRGGESAHRPDSPCLDEIGLLELDRGVGGAAAATWPSRANTLDCEVHMASGGCNAPA